MRIPLEKSCIRRVEWSIQHPPPPRPLLFPSPPPIFSVPFRPSFLGRPGYYRTRFPAWAFRSGERGVRESFFPFWGDRGDFLLFTVSGNFPVPYF